MRSAALVGMSWVASALACSGRVDAIKTAMSMYTTDFFMSALARHVSYNQVFLTLRDTHQRCSSFERSAAQQTSWTTRGRILTLNQVIIQSGHGFDDPWLDPE